jgi:lysyl-tRNA synthetase class II
MPRRFLSASPTRRYDATASAAELQSKYAHLEPGEEVELQGDAMEAVRGRIIARRAFGKLVFCSLNDESGSIQVRIGLPSTSTPTASLAFPRTSSLLSPASAFGDPQRRCGGVI